MTSDPRELRPLLAEEIGRRLPTLENESADIMDVRAALHALRGSAAMAGEHDLALVLAQLAAKVRAREAGARARVAALLREVAERLESGRAVFEQVWPEPPPELSPSVVDARYRAEYVASMHERTTELAALLDDRADPEATVERAYRSIHAMKGAAMSLGDEPVVWYLHGLEGELKACHDAESSARALDELGAHRNVLLRLIDDAEQALDLLRADGGPASEAPSPSRRLGSAPRSVPPPGASKSQPPPEGPEQPDAQLRVPAQAVDHLLDRVERVRLVHQELVGASEAARGTAARLRELRASLLEALRLIGPPKPWGAPAAALARISDAARSLGGAAEGVDRGSTRVRRSADDLLSDAALTRAELAALRRTTVRWLFDRLEGTIRAVAATEGKQVRVQTEGADLPVDRRIAERLLEPMTQLAHNAVAHGIRSPQKRVEMGKPPAGVVALTADRIGDWLRLVVADDGAGVDLVEIRAAAVERGLIGADVAGAQHREELLSLLFVPGLSTRQGADLLAGRGVGLDVVQDAVRRLGGTVRLVPQEHGGLAATVEVPSEGNVTEVLWLQARGVSFALPIGFTGDVSPPSDTEPTVHLAACLGLEGPRVGSVALELRIAGVDRIHIAVDGLGAIEETTIRPIPPLVASSGPYSGAILRGDGSLKLVLDATRLAATAWARAS